MDRLTVQLTVWFETVVMREYSVWFSNLIRHLMVGKGNSSLLHIHVRIANCFVLFKTLRDTAKKAESTALKKVYHIWILQNIRTFLLSNTVSIQYLQTRVSFLYKVVFGCFAVQMWWPVFSAVLVGCVSFPLLLCRPDLALRKIFYI